MADVPCIPASAGMTELGCPRHGSVSKQAFRPRIIRIGPLVRGLLLTKRFYSRMRTSSDVISKFANELPCFIFKKPEQKPCFKAKMLYFQKFSTERQAFSGIHAEFTITVGSVVGKGGRQFLMTTKLPRPFLHGVSPVRFVQSRWSDA